MVLRSSHCVFQIYTQCCQTFLQLNWNRMASVNDKGMLQEIILVFDEFLAQISQYSGILRKSAKTSFCIYLQSRILWNGLTRGPPWAPNRIIHTYMKSRPSGEIRKHVSNNKLNKPASCSYVENNLKNKTTLIYHVS